mmetsp:Transcript_285/g.760  ORF Transcript_285/g.760 Transcript_285/m.760 type:complete len:347 (+) Transcript_285:2082-3122(+)
MAGFSARVVGVDDFIVVIAVTRGSGHSMRSPVDNRPHPRGGAMSSRFRLLSCRPCLCGCSHQPRLGRRHCRRSGSPLPLDFDPDLAPRLGLNPRRHFRLDAGRYRARHSCRELRLDTGRIAGLDPECELSLHLRLQLGGNARGQLGLHSRRQLDRYARRHASLDPRSQLGLHPRRQFSLDARRHGRLEFHPHLIFDSRRQLGLHACRHTSLDARAQLGLHPRRHRSLNPCSHLSLEPRSHLRLDPRRELGLQSRHPVGLRGRIRRMSLAVTARSATVLVPRSSACPPLLSGEAARTARPMPPHRRTLRPSSARASRVSLQRAPRRLCILGGRGGLPCCRGEQLRPE